VLGLPLVWNTLAIFYCVPVRIISFLENRDLTWAQSWRLAGAAMLPGALFLTLGIAAYCLNMMDLIRLGGMFGLHFVIGWIYLFVSPMFCLRTSETKKTAKNPFATGEAATSKSKEKNPFK